MNSENQDLMVWGVESASLKEEVAWKASSNTAANGSGPMMGARLVTESIPRTSQKMSPSSVFLWMNAALSTSILQLKMCSRSSSLIDVSRRHLAAAAELEHCRPCLRTWCPHGVSSLEGP